VVFKGAIGIVIRISPAETRAGALAATSLAAFVGLSLPIVGAGVALAEGVSPRVTLLAFATAVATGIVASAVKLLPARPQGAQRETVANSRGAGHPVGVDRPAALADNPT
jgi:urease accessory protein UreF